MDQGFQVNVAGVVLFRTLGSERCDRQAGSIEIARVIRIHLISLMNAWSKNDSLCMLPEISV